MSSKNKEKIKALIKELIQQHGIFEMLIIMKDYLQTRIEKAEKKKIEGSCFIL